jgi:hypothetical protein
VIAGLGTPSTLSWMGSRSTAPETPAGVVTSASRKAQSAPIGHCYGKLESLRRAWAHRGAYMMTATPARQTSAPVTS